MFLRNLTKLRGSPLLRRQVYSFFNTKFDTKQDYYKILDVSKNATPQQIKKAYYSMAKKYHPDVNKGNQSMFKLVNEAHQVLSDQKTRREYDQAFAFNNFSQKFTQPRGRRTANRQQQQYQQQQQYYNTEGYGMNFDWRENFNSMSFEQQEMVRERLRVLMRNVVIFGISFFFLSWIFLRKPSRIYAVGPDGNFHPAQYQHGMYPMGPPQMMDPYGNPVPMHSRHANPYGVQPQYGQYNPYSANYTYPPNQHPYAPPQQHPQQHSQQHPYAHPQQP